jgi:DinB superfamily
MRNFSRSLFFLVALVVFSGASASTVRAQDASKKTKTPSEAVLEAWNDVGNRLVTMAEDWPEDKYTYKLTPDVRTFQQVLLHVAGSNYDCLNHISGKTMGDAQNDPPVAGYKTKAETVAYLKKSIADGAALIKQEGDGGVVPVQGQHEAGVLAHLDYWIGFTEHMGEHYGLLVAYYRANNQVPPESRPKK